MLVSWYASACPIVYSHCMSCSFMRLDSLPCLIVPQMLIVMSIYAILGVDMFGTFGRDGSFVNVDGESIPLQTSRGLNFGEEYYGSYSRSLFTLFQVMTGESWSEAVARPVIYGKGLEYRSTVFYVSFFLICAIVLINVVVAVLLEKMVDNDPSTEEFDFPPLDPRLMDGIEALKQAAQEGKVAAQESRDTIAKLERDLTNVRDEAAQREMRFLDAIQSLSARLDAAAPLSTSTKEQSHRRRRRSSTRQHSPEVVKTMSTALGDGQEDVYQDGEYSMSKATPGKVVRQLSNGTASMVPTPGEEGDRVKALYTEGKSGLSA